MADYVVPIILGALSSLIASVLFLLFLTRLRPRVVISECIAKGMDSKGEPIYRIKVINRTRVPIINVRVQLHFMRPTVVPGGLIYISKEITFQRSDILELSPFDLKDNTAAYAYRFRSYEDISKLWNDDTQAYLRFRLYATHSVSGFSRVFRKDYQTKRNTLKEGDFAFGNSTEVK
jgi:hypothetical protein